MDVVESTQLTTPQAFNHWYYRAKFDLLTEHVTREKLAPDARIADIGCGLGLFLSYLERTGFSPSQMAGIDPAYTLPTPAVDGNTLIFPEWPSERLFDLILMMHVLEHVEDDRAMLADAASRLAENGTLFIEVPAFPFLYSDHDRFLGHYRRYTTGSLQRLVESVEGLELVKVHYLFATIFPFAAAVRLLRGSGGSKKSSDLKPHAPWLNQSLILAHKLERRLAKLNRFFGLSAFAVARKKSR
ncbi:MAG: class I SAM-dependent methyltransferase [Verrucomicrobia bacterium]|nr:class I SAM-dependent methyltransferase [Verrucomicrobiota bacterium]